MSKKFFCEQQKRYLIGFSYDEHISKFCFCTTQKDGKILIIYTDTVSFLSAFVALYTHTHTLSLSFSLSLSLSLSLFLSNLREERINLA
jgi:hypothetical protein